MATDPILTELHEHREKILKECNNDPAVFFKRLKELERQSPQPAQPPPSPSTRPQGARYVRR